MTVGALRYDWSALLMAVDWKCHYHYYYYFRHHQRRRRLGQPEIQGTFVPVFLGLMRTTP
jgi:hypothetical protein